MEDPCVLVATEPATFLGAACGSAINFMFIFVVVALHWPGLSVLFMTVSDKTFAKSIRGAIWLVVVPQLANGPLGGSL